MTSVARPLPCCTLSAAQPARWTRSSKKSGCQVGKQAAVQRAVGVRIAPSSPLVRSAHNPNNAEIPEQRKDSTSTTNTPPPPSMMTRRNTYVCVHTELPGSERPFLLPNGKANSSGTSRVPPTLPFSHSLALPLGELSRLTRGSTIRSTFHGGQVRDQRAGGGSGGDVQNGPPASHTLAQQATPFPSRRPCPTTNLFTKLTSKLSRRVTEEPERIWGPEVTVAIYLVIKRKPSPGFFDFPGM